MIAASKTSSKKLATPGKRPERPPPAIAEEFRERISPTERWLLISRKMYARAQKRGFVGGDMLQDLSEIAQEIDEEYTTDYQGIFALTDSSQIIEQLRSVFASKGLAMGSLDRLLEMQRDGFEKLAASNRSFIDSTSKLAGKPSHLLQDVANETAKALQTFARDWALTEGVAERAEKTAQAIRKAMSELGGATVASSVDSARTEKQGADTLASESRIRGNLVKAYRDEPLRQLVDAPVAALKGVSKQVGKQLKKELGMTTIGDMATGKLTLRATAASRELEALHGLADTSLKKLKGVNKRQAALLQDSFHIKTLRDLAEHRLFRIARAIVLLAEAD